MATNFSTSTWNANEYLMKAGLAKCGFNTPPALKSKKSGDLELSHSLPPYAPRRAFLVDKYPACPAEWVRGEGRLSSYFVPIVEDNGLWLDFSMNAALEYDLAVLVSVQGVNAITGLPCDDHYLEQYLDKCPKHNVAFGPGRLCTKCNYKWPKQNYLASTGNSWNNLWLDGFRAADGAVRQYVLTAEKSRGVANAVLGERRVFAIGISFFLSKTKRPLPPERDDSGLRFFGGGLKKSFNAEHYYHPMDGGDLYLSGGGDKTLGSSNVLYSASNDIQLTSQVNEEIVHEKISAKISNRSLSNKPRATAPRYGASGQSAGNLMSSMPVPVKTKKLEIAAGAKIDQQVVDDPQELSYWRDECDSILVVNYCTEADAEAILAGGTADLEGSSEGFLQKIPTGN